MATQARRKTKDQRIQELLEIQSRGEAMEKLFQDPIISKFFIDYERKAYEQLLACSIDDHEGRLNRSVMINVTRQVLQDMKQVIEAGRRAAKDIARRTERSHT